MQLVLYPNSSFLQGDPQGEPIAVPQAGSVIVFRPEIIGMQPKDIHGAFPLFEFEYDVVNIVERPGLSNPGKKEVFYFEGIGGQSKIK